MNARTRYVETLRFGAPDRAFLRHEHYWPETLRRWQREGHIKDESTLNEMFVFDQTAWLPCFTEMVPPFEDKILAEAGDSLIKQDANGKLFVDKKDQTSAPHYFKYTIENRRDWDYHKWRFDPEKTDERLSRDWLAPGQPIIDWDALEQRHRNRDYPLGIAVGGYFGWINGLMPTTTACTIFLDDPDLVHEMFDTRTRIVEAFLERLLPRFHPEWAHFYEDMAFNHGPFISPALFREFMMPYYKRVTAVLKKHNVPVIDVDSDGNHNVLTPLWLESGVNCLFPYEVATGMDPVADREKYGKRLAIIGGIDKRPLAQGKTEIEREVLSKVPRLLEQGGYVPAIDHHVPPDVPFENFVFYRRLVEELVGVSA